MAGRYEFVEEAPRYEFVDEPAAKPEKGITSTGGSMPTAGGVVGTAFKIAEAMGTPEGRAEARNLLIGGPLRGVAGLGSTLLWPVDKALDAIAGDRVPGLSSLVTGEKPKTRNEERRASIDEFFRDNFNPDSIAFQTGKIGTEIGGTMGAGSVLAGPVRAVAGASPVLNGFANALRSGGMQTGVQGLGRAADLGVRMTGGGIAGAASAGMADPDSAGVGFAIGAALPPGLQAANAVATAAGKAVRTLRPGGGASGADVRAARDIASMAGADTRNLDEVARIRDALRQEGPSIIPGSQTVPELLQEPGISQLQRSVKAIQPAPLVTRDAEREVARRDVLGRIATPGNPQQVAEDVGNRIAEYAVPAELAARRRVSALFDAVPSQEAVMHLPLQRMEEAQAQFLGPGTFGKGNASVAAALNEARAIGTRPAANAAFDYSSSDLSRRSAGRLEHGIAGPAESQPIPFDQLQKLRSSIGEAITDAERYGNNQAKAALTAMKNAIDNKVADVAAGNVLPGEVFTPQAIDAWGQALNAHAAKRAQFNTGPQAALFRRGGDGLPVAQGAELPRRFFNANASQVADAQSFRRLVQDDPRMMADLRRYAVSQAAEQTDRFGNLTNAKFNRWLDARSGATGEVFSEQQRAWLKAIAEDLRRADVAESLGRSTGSDTAQKAASMLRLGLLDSPATHYVARKLPLGSAALDFVGGRARAAKAERLGGLLADPERTAGLLDTFIATQQPRPTGLLGAAASDPLLHRAAPLLLSGGSR